MVSGSRAHCGDFLLLPMAPCYSGCLLLVPGCSKHAQQL